MTSIELDPSKTFLFLTVAKNRNFRNLWFAQIISQLAFNMMSFILALRIYQTTNSNTAVSILVLIIGIPSIFFGILAGTLVDRWDKRNVLVATNLLRMIFLLGFFASSETLIWVYLLVLAISITTQFFVPAEAPTIPRLVEAPLLLTANSLFTFTFYTSMIIGFIFAGPTLKIFGSQNAFLFLSACFALAALFVSRIPSEEKKEEKELIRAGIESVWKGFLSGVEFIRGRREIAASIFLLVASQVLTAALVSLTPGFAHKILQIEIEDASFIIMGPAVVGMVVGALLIGQFGRKFSKRTLTTMGIFLGGIFLLLLSAVVKFPNIPVAILSLAFLGVACSLVNVPANTVLQTDTPPALQGRVYGVLTSFIGGAAILPVVLTGVAADIFGVGKVISGIAGTIFLFGIYRVVKERYNRSVKSQM